jgi:anti-anti-sigma regulatory factor
MAPPRRPSTRRAAPSAAASPAPAPAAAAVGGDWNIYRAAELRTQLAGLVSSGCFDLDLSGVTEFDSSGLQLLAALRASAARAGRPARFLSPSPCVVDTCRTLGLEPWLSGSEGAVA